MFTAPSVRSLTTADYSCVSRLTQNTTVFIAGISNLSNMLSALSVRSLTTADYSCVSRLTQNNTVSIAGICNLSNMFTAPSVRSLATADYSCVSRLTQNITTVSAVGIFPQNSPHWGSPSGTNQATLASNSN